MIVIYESPPGHLYRALVILRACVWLCMRMGGSVPLCVPVCVRVYACACAWVWVLVCAGAREWVCVWA